MAKQTNTQPDNSSSRVERILSFMAIGLIATSVLCILATLILALVFHNANTTKAAVVLPLYPFIGLSVGALCIIGVVVASIVRRSRTNNQR
jgi:FtsH-binding integral membrane protein